MAKKPSLRDALLAGPVHGVKPGPPDWMDTMQRKHPAEAAELEEVIAEFIADGPVRKKFKSRNAFAEWLVTFVAQFGVEFKRSAMKCWLEKRQAEQRNGRRS